MVRPGKFTTINKRETTTMDATTILFTMWVGSFDYHGTWIGRVVASVPACAAIAAVRPTMDAQFEIVPDDDSTDNTNMVRRNS